MAESREVTAFGETKRIFDWAKDPRCKVLAKVITRRIFNKGWNPELAITTESSWRKLVVAFGEAKTYTEWIKDSRCKLSRRIVFSRISQGWSLEDAMMIPFENKEAEESVGKIFFDIKILSLFTKEIDNEDVLHINCRCEICGKEFSRKFSVSKKVIRCLCYKPKRIKRRYVKHGQYLSPYYYNWTSLTDRCENPSMPAYKDYGGRGIYVCQEWKRGQENEMDLLNFLNWCEKNPRPSKRHSLDRNDNDGPYSPDNCSWKTAAEQNMNRRNAAFYQRAIAEKDRIITELQKQIENLKQNG